MGCQLACWWTFEGFITVYSKSTHIPYHGHIVPLILSRNPTCWGADLHGGGFDSATTFSTLEWNMRNWVLIGCRGCCNQLVSRLEIKLLPASPNVSWFFGHEELENFPLKYIRCFHVHLDMPLQGPLPMLLAQLLLLCTCWQRAAPILVWIAGILERSPARCLPSCYVLNVLCMIVHPLSLKYLLCAPTWIHMGYSHSKCL